MISIIFLNEYIDDVVEEVNAKEALKSSIFVVQKAAAPKTGVESRQSSIGTIRSSLATSYDVWRRRATSTLFFGTSGRRYARFWCGSLLYDKN